MYTQAAHVVWLEAAHEQRTINRAVVVTLQRYRRFAGRVAVGDVAEPPACKCGRGA